MLSGFGNFERDIAGIVAPAESRAFPRLRPVAHETPEPVATSRTGFGVVPSVILHGAVLVFLLIELAGGHPVAAPQVTLVSLVAPVAETTKGEAARAAPEAFKPMPHPPQYQPPEPAPALAAMEPIVMPIPEPDAVALDKPKPKEKKKSVAQAALTKPEKKLQPKPQTAKAKPAALPQPIAAPQIAAPTDAAASQASAAQMATAALATATTVSSVNSGATTAEADAPVMITDPGYAGACPISYPARAQRRNQQGTVVIRALIGTDGRPTEVLVKSSSGFRLLDEAAIDAIADCAFKPQTVGGKPVKAIVEIPIPFRLI